MESNHNKNGGTPPEKGPSNRSILGLDWMIFLCPMSGLGLGPFYLCILSPTSIGGRDAVGIALGTIDLTAAICQIPSGFLVDSIKTKRSLILLSCLAISIACLLILHFPQFSMVIFAQSLIGVAAAIIPPTIAAITLGLVKREQFPKRVSINETWGHTGNVITAALVGISGYMLGVQWIFYSVVLCAAASSFFLKFIDPKEIDHAAARELGNSESENKAPIAIFKYLRHSYLLIFCISVFFFHFSNGAHCP